MLLTQLLLLVTSLCDVKFTSCLLQYSRNVSQTRWVIDDERMGEASVEVPQFSSGNSHFLKVTFEVRLGTIDTNNNLLSQGNIRWMHSSIVSG